MGANTSSIAASPSVQASAESPEPLSVEQYEQLLRELRDENARLSAAQAALDLVQRAHVSEAKVAEFVERIVANDATNIVGLPDHWERAIEKKALLIALTMAADAISNMHVDDILGHRIRFVVEPMPDAVHEESSVARSLPVGVESTKPRRKRRKLRRRVKQ